ncbi:hypothetical protein WA026_008307 [Henosepilachna vigintioctopunctata]
MSIISVASYYSNEDIFEDDESSDNIITFQNSPQGKLFYDFNSNKDFDYHDPEYIDWNLQDVSQKEKKSLHSRDQFCMNVPIKKKLLEESAYDFRPNTVLESKCESIPSPGLRDPLLIPHNAVICKVENNCKTYSKEITVFRKQKEGSRSGKKHCWTKVPYNLTVGCKCVSHILHQL